MTRHADEVKLETTVEERRLIKSWRERRHNYAEPGCDCVDCKMQRDLEVLLAAHAALTAKCERLEGLLREIEWGGSDHISGSDDDKPACPYCGSISPQEWTRDFAPSRNGHRDYCKLAAALAPQPEGDKT